MPAAWGLNPSGPERLHHYGKNITLSASFFVALIWLRGFFWGGRQGADSLLQ